MRDDQYAEIMRRIDAGILQLSGKSAAEAQALTEGKRYEQPHKTPVVQRNPMLQRLNELEANTNAMLARLDQRRASQRLREAPSGELKELREVGKVSKPQQPQPKPGKARGLREAPSVAELQERINEGLKRLNS